MLCVSCLPTASLFLLLLPCLPAQKGGEHEQSADVISVWEGDSISITCSISDHGKHVGMYLKTNGGTVNVIYLSKDKLPNVSPDIADRATGSQEGKNYRITLHNVQQSDSNVYLCTEYALEKDHHKILDGKKTIVVVKAKTGGALEQSPFYASPWQGQSINITCVMNGSGGGQEFYLLRTLVQPETVLRVSNWSNATILPAFAKRLDYSKAGRQIVITLRDLQEDDTDNYVCVEEVKMTKNSRLLSASGTMVVVKDAEGMQAHSQQACSDSFWIIYILIIVVALLFCALVCCTLHHVNIKKYFQKETPNIVYEDMSFSSRRNTLVRTNTNSKAN